MCSCPGVVFGLGGVASFGGFVLDGFGFDSCLVWIGAGGGGVRALPGP